MRVLHDIEWDLEDCAVDPDTLELPDSVDVPDDIEDNDIENWLSDEFGFLVLAYTVGKEEG